MLTILSWWETSALTGNPYETFHRKPKITSWGKVKRITKVWRFHEHLHTVSQSLIWQSRCFSPYQSGRSGKRNALCELHKTIFNGKTKKRNWHFYQPLRMCCLNYKKRWLKLTETGFMDMELSLHFCHQFCDFSWAPIPYQWIQHWLFTLSLMIITAYFNLQMWHEYYLQRERRTYA